MGAARICAALFKSMNILLYQVFAIASHWNKDNSDTAVGIHDTAEYD